MIETGLYLILSVAIGSVFFGKRNTSLALLAGCLVLGFFVLWHIAAGTLKM